MKNWLKALLSETILSIRLVAHLSFFERWDSTSLSRLGSMDSADARQVLSFSGNRRNEKEARRYMSPRLPTFAKNKGAKVGHPARISSSTQPQWVCCRTA